jgi:hypothetical protein
MFDEVIVVLLAVYIHMKMCFQLNTSIEQKKRFHE